MKKIRYFLEYTILKLISKILHFLPRQAVLFLGARVGDLVFYCIPVRKKITLEHLRLAFPEKSEDDIRRIAREAYRNLGMNSFEHLCLPYLSSSELISTVQLNDEDILKRVFASNKGTIFVGGHFGNWEYMGGAVSAMGYPVTFIVADIANPYINKMVNVHRQKAGVNILFKGISVRGIIKTLRGNGFLAMLIDQDAGRSGIFVNYFQRPCSAPRGPALFALKTGAALVYVSSIRQPDGSLRAAFEEMEVDYEAGVTEENIMAIMQRCTARLEADVRRYPGQWFWMHRRWKTVPTPVEEKG
ncbi:MAG: lysophospholipid acyltransferase family protein [Desulfopila sp.]